MFSLQIADTLVSSIRLDSEPSTRENAVGELAGVGRINRGVLLCLSLESRQNACVPACDQGLK